MGLETGKTEGQLQAENATGYEYATFPRQFVSYRWFKPLLVGLLTLFFIFIFQIIALVFAAAWDGNPDFLSNLNLGYDDMNPYTGPGAMALIGGVATMLPALALATLIVRDRPFSSYSSSRGGWNWKAFGKCLVVALVVVVVPSIVQVVFFPDPNATGLVSFTVAGTIACIVLIPLQCLAEEYVFRGFLIQAVGSWTKMPVLAILVSAAVFAAGHPYNVTGVITIFGNGLIWGYVVWKSRGLEATSALHIINNMAAFGLGGLGIAPTTSQVDVASLVVAFVADIVFAALVLGLGKKYNWFTAQGDGTVAFNEKRRAALACKQNERTAE